MRIRHTIISAVLACCLLSWLLAACGSSGSLSKVNPGTNIPPTAMFSMEDTPTGVPATVRFDATASTDPDGEIVNYSWDFDGDLDFDMATDEPAAAYEYTEAGTYSVTLTVEDDQGSCQSRSVSCVVPGWQSYTLDFRDPLIDIRPPEEGVENVALAEINGKPAIVWRASLIYRPGTKTSITGYCQALNANGMQWHDQWFFDTTLLQEVLEKEENKAEHADIGLLEVNGNPAAAWFEKYTNNLVYRLISDTNGAQVTVDSDIGETDCLRLVLRKINGRPAIVYTRPSGDSGNYTLSYISAADDDGHAWNARVDVDVAQLSYPTNKERTQFFDLVEAENRPAVCWYGTENGSDLRYKRAETADGSSWPASYVSVSNNVDNGCSMAMWQPAGESPCPVIIFGYNNFLYRAQGIDSVGSEWGSFNPDNQIISGYQIDLFTIQPNLFEDGTLGFFGQGRKDLYGSHQPVLNRLVCLDSAALSDESWYPVGYPESDFARDIKMTTVNGHPVVVILNDERTTLEVLYYNY